jgi:hypothetical protein
MTLAGVQLRWLNASDLSFRGALDVEKAVFTDIDWPRDETDKRFLLRDERDLKAAPELAEEVERIYRSIRKNFEDRGARVVAHDWYFSEMEVGRFHSARRLTRLARWFYKQTSNYGLSALRPAVCLLMAAVVAFLLFSIPSMEICPVVRDAGADCVGWANRLEVVLLAIFLQPVPAEASLTGPLSVLTWLLLRIVGAAMLVSFAVAFRNQVAR